MPARRNGHQSRRSSGLKLVGSPRKYWLLMRSEEGMAAGMKDQGRAMVWVMDWMFSGVMLRVEDHAKARSVKAMRKMKYAMAARLSEREKVWAWRRMVHF